MRTAWRFPETIKTRPVFDATRQTRTGCIPSPEQPAADGTLQKLSTECLSSCKRFLIDSGSLLAASGFVRRSFDQTGNISPTFDHD
jgi:hypothetical protein